MYPLYLVVKNNSVQECLTIWDVISMLGLELTNDRHAAWDTAQSKHTYNKEEWTESEALKDFVLHYANTAISGTTIYEARRI